MSSRPIIGCTTYHKIVTRNPYLEVCGLWVRYKEALLAAGATPVLIPQGLTQDDLRAMLKRVDGILLPGGGDVHPRRYNGSQIHPTVAGIDEDRDELELFVAREAMAQDMPLLAICRGHQVLNVALGGTLWQDVYAEMPEAIEHNYYRPNLARNALTHAVSLTPGSKLADMLGQRQSLVNSLHHQGVREVAPGLAATAMAPDDLVEALEAPDHLFAVGVQWHPEELWQDEPAMLRLFEGLVTAARRWAQ